jgi:hypothetical protein
MGEHMWEVMSSTKSQELLQMNGVATMLICDKCSSKVLGFRVFLCHFKEKSAFVDWMCPQCIAQTSCYAFLLKQKQINLDYG